MTPLISMQHMDKKDVTLNLFSILQFLEESNDESDYQALRAQLNYCLHVIASLDETILPPVAVIKAKGRA